MVHLYLEHLLVQWLLAQFTVQGFVKHELSRVCVCVTEKAVDYVVFWGRVSLYGRQATRLHDELFAVAAPWKPYPLRGQRPLRPLGPKDRNLVGDLERSLAAGVPLPEGKQGLFRDSLSRDAQDPLPYLEQEANQLIAKTTKQLTIRGEREAKVRGHHHCTNREY